MSCPSQPSAKVMRFRTYRVHLLGLVHLLDLRTNDVFRKASD